MSKTPGPEPEKAASPALPEGPLSFPYKTMDAAIKDAFRRVGGPDEALRFLGKGWKNFWWRRRTESRSKEQEVEEARLAGIVLKKKP